MNLHWKSIWLICLKDIKDLVRNFRFLFAFALPLLLNLLFRFVINPEGLSKIGLVDASMGDVGKRYSEILGQASTNISFYNIEQQLVDAVRRGDVKIGVYLFNADQCPNLSSTTTARFFVKKDDPVGSSLAILSEQIINSLSTPLSEKHISVEYKQVERNNQDYFSILAGSAGRAFSAFGWAIFSGLNAGIFLIPPLIIEEKWRRTLDAILSAKVSYLDFIFGKALVGWFVVSIAMIMSVIVGGGIPWNESIFPKSWILFLAITFISLLGTLLGVAFDNFAPVFMLGFPINIFLLIPLSLLLGIDTPGLNIILKLIPTFYLFKAFIGTLGAPVNNYLLDATLFVLGVILLILALTVVLLRRKSWH